MRINRIKIKLPNKQKELTVLLGNDFLLEKIEEIFPWENYSGCFLVVDQKLQDIGKKIAEQLSNKFHRLQIVFLEAGEKIKNWRFLLLLYKKLTTDAFDRKTILVAVGGGTIGDLAGFAAATYLRGVDFVQIPTTLLAQVDAAIGGKTGINFVNLKNIIGAFYQPKAVIIDVNFLKTLSEREFNSGMAEVIKYGVVFDKNIFEILETQPVAKIRNKFLENIIKKCVCLKTRVVSADEKENNYRLLLNFGHTLGHAIEISSTNYQHGEAVAIGMMGASLISQQLGLLKTDRIERIKNLLLKFDLPITCSISPVLILKKIRGDKKRIKDKIRWVLLEDIGKAIIYQNVNEETILKTINQLCLC